MDFYDQDLYLGLEQFLLDNKRSLSNCVILTVPGMGIRYFAKKFLEKNTEGISYVDSEGGELGEFSIVDPDFYLNKEALSLADQVFKSAGLNQKIALVVNDPSVLRSDVFQKTFLASRLYQNYYFGARCKKDIEILVDEIREGLKGDQMEKIFTLSGGVGRLAKFLAINIDLLDWPIEKILSQDKLRRIMKPTIDVLKRCSNEIWQKLGVADEMGVISPILKFYLVEETEDNLSTGTEIVINRDLSFEEKGLLSKNRLTRVEAKILSYLKENGVIERERISDFKWGEGLYDKWSDQAINKTVQRLNDKLIYYTLVAIPKVGYKIERRGDER